MYRQSKYVLALFLGSSQATKLNSNSYPMPSMALAGSESAGLDVNSDVAAVIETSTKASVPTQRK